MNYGGSDRHERRRKIFDGSGTAPALTSATAQQLAEQVTARVVADLEQMDSLLFGDPGGLINTWEEICVQMQSERSIFWRAYDASVRALIDAHLEDLTVAQRQQVWLETDRGAEWWCEYSHQQDAIPPACDDDMISFIAEHYLYPRADEFANDRTRAYLMHSCADGDQ